LTKLAFFFLFSKEFKVFIFSKQNLLFSKITNKDFKKGLKSLEKNKILIKIQNTIFYFEKKKKHIFIWFFKIILLPLHQVE
jgi:hypothetical protein